MATPAPDQHAQLTGAQALVRSLEEVGTDVVFGIPGGAILPAYDPLYDSRKVRHILVRHEQGAGHAAEGYAQVTGRVGVCMATSGPGATNLVTPIANAFLDSVPIVAITGQVPLPAVGTDAFQEADISGITLPITKHNFLVQRAEQIPQTIAEAFHLAATGRPGPVLVDIPKDILQQQTTFRWPPVLDLPGYRPVTRPHGKQIREAAGLIATARRPVLYVGGGVLKARATAELAQFAELSGIPVVTTLMARGAFPDSAPPAPGDARHARHGGRGHRAAEGGSADRAGHPVRRPGDRPAGLVRTARGGDPCRHRPCRDRQEPGGRRADRGRCPRGDRRADHRVAGRVRRRHTAPT